MKTTISAILLAILASSCTLTAAHKSEPLLKRAVANNARADPGAIILHTHNARSTASSSNNSAKKIIARNLVNDRYPKAAALGLRDADSAAAAPADAPAAAPAPADAPAAAPAPADAPAAAPVAPSDVQLDGIKPASSAVQISSAPPASTPAPSSTAPPATNPTPPAGDSFSGEGTHYDPSVGVGACGTLDSNEDLVCAINTFQYGNDANPNLAKVCGKCISINYKNPSGQTNSVKVKVVDRCPVCKFGDIDLSAAAFLKLAPLGVGRIKIDWKFVNC
ncbi:Papain inhibitor [Smittium culicis]|uniref:Papain inhibitor n=1 Tax=Smittium culicis TaxID=133412 RepID=A0A1R1Y825_9FUNG|nr:Papain inhibitor [Smittium culicis]